MTEHQDQYQDPPRLLELEGLPSELEGSLRDAAQDGLDEASVMRVTEGVLADLGVGATAGSGGVLGSAGAKALAGVLGVGVLVGGVWLGTRSDGPHVRESAAPVVLDVAQEASVPEKVETILEEPSPVKPPTVVKEPARSVRNAAPPPSDSSSASSLAEEHRLLRAARVALSADPARALALTREHERRFPHGVLAQEREVIAIRALALAGDREAAQKKAEGFEEAYPKSPHRDRVNEVTDGGK